MRRRSAALAVAIAIGAFSPATGVSREGFGFPKRSAKLRCHIPPAIHLQSKKIAVELENSSDETGNEAAAMLRGLIETKLTTSNLRVDTKHPDAVVKVSLTGLDYTEALETRTDTEFRETGTKQEWDAKKGRYETVPAYENVTVYRTFKRVTASVQARVEVVDQKTKTTTHVANVESTFDQSFQNGAGAPPREEVEDYLVEETAAKAAAQLVGSAEVIAVFLPRGSFDSAVALAQQGVWDLYYAAVTAVPVKRRSADEAYRQYALGVANEAMAYRAKDVDETMNYLRIAESHYLKAAEMKPAEKLFGSEPIQRVQSGIAECDRRRQFRMSRR